MTLHTPENNTGEGPSKEGPSPSHKEVRQEEYTKEVQLTRSLTYSGKLWRDIKSGQWMITVGMEGNISSPIDLDNPETSLRATAINYFLISKYRELETLLSEADAARREQNTPQDERK